MTTYRSLSAPKSTTGATTGGPTGGQVKAILITRHSSRLRGFLWRHRAFLTLLGLGALLRIAVFVAYPPAFWYDGDSGKFLALAAAPTIEPDSERPYGYVLVLRLLRLTESTAWVSTLQHLLGLALAVLVYTVLVRREVPRWLGCLATVPLLVDSLLLNLEHMVLSDALCIAAVAGAIVALLWSPRPGVVACTVSGVLLAASWFIRPLALPIAILAALSLVWLRTGWRTWASFGLAFAIPMLGVLLWIDGRPSPYGSNNLALYSRTAGIADCTQLSLSPQARELCPPSELRGRRPDLAAWLPESPGHRYLSNVAAPELREFAIAVVTKEPARYLRAVGRETAAHFLPGVDLGPEFACLSGRYSLPETARPLPDTSRWRCVPEIAANDFSQRPVDAMTNPGPSPLRHALAVHSTIGRTPPLAVSAAFVLILLAVLLRRSPRPILVNMVTMAAIAATVIVLPVLIGMYEPRYAVVGLPFLCIGSALAVQQLLSGQPRALLPRARHR